MAERFGSIWLPFNKVFNERKSACLVRILLVADELLDNLIGAQLMEFLCRSTYPTKKVEAS